MSEAGWSTWPHLPLVYFTTGHVVSDSMVSRAYLKDAATGVVVGDPGGGLWLVSTSSVLAPDQKSLKRRGEDRGGPPARSSKVSLTKVYLEWPDPAGLFGDGGKAELANPRVTCHPDGLGIAVLPINAKAGTRGGIEEGSNPVPLSMTTVGQIADPGPPGVSFRGELMAACVHPGSDGSRWSIRRSCPLASDPRVGFGGVLGVAALDIAHIGAGSPVYSLSDSGPDLEGIVRPVTPVLAELLPTRLILETIEAARPKG